MPISSSSERLTFPHERSTASIHHDTKSSHEAVKSREVIKPRKVTLPSIAKLKLENNVVVARDAVNGRSLSHGSAANKHQPISAHTLNQHKPSKSTHHPDRQHHPGPHHHHHKKRKPKKEKEGDDITLRKIRYFSCHPEPAPLTLCLSYPGVDLSHKRLLDAITSLGTIDADDIQSIQFVDMNCILGTAGVDNRWLITVKDFDTRYLLLRDCVWIDDDPLHFRLLDDVNMEDYKEYKRRMATLESDEHVSAVERLLALHGQI